MTELKKARAKNETLALTVEKLVTERDDALERLAQTSRWLKACLLTLALLVVAESAFFLWMMSQ